MNKKKHFILKKNVVNILALILGGFNTNDNLNEKLKKKQSTISEHLSPILKEGIISVKNIKARGEKEYCVNIERVAELFFTLYPIKKSFIKFKNNNFIQRTFFEIIRMKKGLSEKNPKLFSQITLLDIFKEVHEVFLTFGIMICRDNKEIRAINGWTSDEKTISQFRVFLKEMYNDFKESSHEEIERELRQKADSGNNTLKNLEKS